MKDLKYWLSFNQISTFGPIRWQKLLDYFNSLEDAWFACSSELMRAGISSKIIDELLERRAKINPDFEVEKLQKINGQVITILDSSYPKLLKEIYAPPPLLYYFGELDLNNDFTLGVVGSRKISEYGNQITEQIVGELVQVGLTIVSGLALGVDACAHQTTIKFGGKTIAVLGSGLGKIYPASNRQIAQKIIESGGAIITEFPIDMSPLKYNFPQRNRIISGLSLGTLVTEASLKSGALITAKYALDQNREVFATPGNIYNENCIGPNNLIKMGAKVVTSSSDILETLNLEQAKEFKEAKKVVPSNNTEKILLEVIQGEPVHVDKIVQCAKLDISTVNSTLSIMEMKGMVKCLGNQKYIKAR